MIKNLLRKLIFGYKASSETYINFLRGRGAIIGRDVKIFSPANTNIDVSHPHMLTIGSNVNMTGPVTILNHDYSGVACKDISGGSGLGNVRPVIIGDNVFIGWGATILAGSRIGDNVIIGAASVVAGKVENNSVYCGNPAKKLMSIEEYVERRKAKQLSEAEDIYSEYLKHFGRTPPEELFGNYKNVFRSQNSNGTTTLFDGYEDFAKHISDKR